MWFVKKLKLRLREKITIILILLIIISITAIGVASVLAQYQALIDDTGKRLTSLAYYAASHINGDDLLQIKDSQSEESENYNRVHKELEQVIESANKIPISQISEILRMEGKSAGKNLKAVYAYTLREDGDKVLYGADAFSAKDSANYERPGSIVTNSNQVKNVSQIYSGIPYFSSEPYTDNYGTWITGYARVFDSNDNVAGVVCVDASIEFIYGKAWNLAVQIIIFGIMLIVIVSVLSFYLARKITKPLIMLNEGAGIIGNGDLDYNLTIKTGDEIEDLAGAFNKMAEKLKLYIEDLRVTTAEKEHIQSELKIAHNIQTSMLPRIFPPFPERQEFSIYAMMEPAKEVGGDFFDFFFIEKNKLCFLIGDVSGKGVPAALFMVITKTLLKNQALLGISTAEILYNTNNLLCLENEELMFVTVFIGIINTDTGEFQFSNAGHNPPLVSKRGSEFDYLKPKKSFVLAGMENFKFQSETIQLEKGDAVFLYTDGVTEAMNAYSEQFSEARLKEDLRLLGYSNEREIVDSIREKIGLFVKDTPASDDITMLVLRYHGNDVNLLEQEGEPGR
jgi:serine phosphatase RsbU (regulator of sigma subunit)